MKDFGKAWEVEPMKTEETGERIKMRGTINCEDAEPVLLWLAKRLAESYGGCTVLPQGDGYWVTDAGELQNEPATIVEVSFEASNVGAVDYVRHLFTTAQLSVGGEWCHIEESTFTARHTHINHTLPS